MALSQEMKDALTHYGKTIKEKGVEAGEPLIEEGIKKFGPEFRQWAMAVRKFLQYKIQTN